MTKGDGEERRKNEMDVYKKIGIQKKEEKKEGEEEND